MHRETKITQGNHRESTGNFAFSDEWEPCGQLHKATKNIQEDATSANDNTVNFAYIIIKENKNQPLICTKDNYDRIIGINRVRLASRLVNTKLEH